MPVNYQQVQQQIREKAKNAPARLELRRERTDKARELLQQHAEDLSYLQGKVAQAAAADKGLRCAVPVTETLQFSKAVQQPETYPVMLAADGSQINPNRHDAFEFGLINIGIIRLQPRQAVTPVEWTNSELILDDSPDGGYEPLTEEYVALLRDYNERRELVQLAAAETQTVLTLTDGPLELFREPRGNQRFDKLFIQYLDVLEQLASIQAVTAGYVDKPGSDLVVRMLELTQYDNESLQRAGRERKLGGVRDIDLFRGGIAPGERTAIFAIQSSSADKFSQRLNGQIALHFFYLNVGIAGKSWLARVEIPAWVSHRPELVDLLQATLLQQCRQMGLRPYPYALHRAHEVALVTYREKEQLQTMIEAEMHRHGVETGQKSNKQSAKDLTGRKGYKS